MKVIGINGSTRANGNTQAALKEFGRVLQLAGHEMEIIELRKMKLNPCHACGQCSGTKMCVQKDDINEIFQKLDGADGIVLASPVYFSNVTARMAMFIERTGTMFCANERCFKGKIGASIAVARRAGTNVVYAMLNYYFGIGEMPIASSRYWNNIMARDRGDYDQDEEGIKIIQTLAHNMSNMLEKLR